MGYIRSSLRSAATELYRVDPVIDGVLRNWGAWNLPRHGGSSTNAMFRMVKPSETFEARSVGPGVDVDSAWLAEKVICNPGFYPRARALLSNHYVWQVDQWQTCRQLGLHRTAYDEELWRSTFIFWNRYEPRANSR